MKKTLLFVACIFAFVNLSKAQNFKTTWGAEFDTKVNAENIVGETEEAVFLLDGFSKCENIYVFDSKTLGMSFERKVELPKINDKKAEFVEGLVFGGKFYLFVTTSNGDKKTLYAISVDGKGVLAKTPQKIDAFNVNSSSHRFKFVMSDDKSHLMILFFDNFTERGIDKEVPTEVKALDKELKLVNSADCKSFFFEKRFLLLHNSVSVDDNGDIYIMANRLLGGELLSYDIVHYSSGKEPIKYSIELSKFLTDLGESVSATTSFMVVNSEGDLCIGGYYRVKEVINALPLYIPQGTFFVKIDNDNQKIALVEASPFSEEIKAKTVGGETELISYMGSNFGPKTKKVVVKEDGGIILFSEVSDYSASFNSFMIHSFDKNGKVEWANGVSKSQFGIKRERNKYFSAVIAVDGKNINFLYLDNTLGTVAKSKSDYRIIMKDDIEVLKLTEISIGYDGKNYVKKVIGDALSNGVAILPRTNIEGKDGSILLFGEYQKVNKLGPIKL